MYQPPAPSHADQRMQSSCYPKCQLLRKNCLMRFAIKAWTTCAHTPPAVLDQWQCDCNLMERPAQKCAKLIAKPDSLPAHAELGSPNFHDFSKHLHVSISCNFLACLRCRCAGQRAGNAADIHGEQRRRVERTGVGECLQFGNQTVT